MPDLAGLVRRIAEQAAAGEQVEAYASWHKDTDVRVFEGEIEQLTSAESAGVGVRVIVGGRQGFAHVGELDDRAGREALEEARDNASFATPDEHAGLAEADGVAPVSLELWREGVGSTPTADKAALALELEARVRGADQRIRQVVSADYSDGEGEWAIAASTGIAAAGRRSGCSLSVGVIAGEGDDTQTASGSTVSREPSGLDLSAAADDAIGRAIRLLGARRARSRRLTVVLDRRVTATLLSILGGTLSGEAVAKGRSLFAGRLGEEVAVPGFSLVEDPTNEEAYAASAHDAEGLACRRTALVEHGRLGAYLYDTYSARLAGAVSTASAVRGGFKSAPGVGARALAVEPGEGDEAAVLAKIGEGLFVQSVSGVHSGVNPISGDFSVGIQGLFFRDGTFAEPVREVTIASTIQKMLLNVLAIGGDLEWRPGNAAGVTLAIDDVALSGD